MRNYITKSNRDGLPDSITAEKLGGGEINSYLVELANAVISSGQTPAVASGIGEVLDQLGKALAIYGAGGAGYHKDTGAVNAYVLNPVSPRKSPNAYFDGFTVTFTPGTINTSASTVNIASLGVKSITINGVAAKLGEIRGLTTISFNLSADRFDIVLSKSTNYYNSVDYVKGETKLGSDGIIYECLIDNGPSSSVVNPVGDVTGTWVDLKNPGQSLIGNGYQVFPSGLILQWGAATADLAGLPVVFPIAFPTAILGFGGVDTGTPVETQSIVSPTVTGFDFYSTGTSEGAYWLAVGY